MDNERTRKNLTHLYNLSFDALEKLRLPANPNIHMLEHLFVAGKKFDGSEDYSRLFSRDGYTSCRLKSDPDMLRDFLIFNSFEDGKTTNPETCEELGKPPHEWPGVIVRGKNTQFCASDIAQLDLIGWSEYLRLTRDVDLLRIHRQAIERRVHYLLAHLDDDGLFIESPKYVGLNEFPLKATYFRDWGIFNGMEKKRFNYPVAYLLVQAQTIAALRALKELSKYVLLGVPRKVIEHIEKKALSSLLTAFWEEENQRFVIARDAKEIIPSEYADPLHMLFYLKRGDIPKEKLAWIWKMARGLSSPVGIATYRRNYTQKDEKIVVWPFEQALFADIGLRFRKKEVVRDAGKIIDCLASFERPFTEYVFYNDFTGEATPGGCEIQLWTIAAVHYFWRMREKIFL